MYNDHLDTIERIAEGENDLETLKALRRKIAKALDSTKSARDIASLSRQMITIIEKIAELEEQDKDDDPVRELLERRNFGAVRDRQGRALHGSQEIQKGEET